MRVQATGGHSKHGSIEKPQTKSSPDIDPGDKDASNTAIRKDHQIATGAKAEQAEQHGQAGFESIHEPTCSIGGHNHSDRPRHEYEGRLLNRMVKDELSEKNDQKATGIKKYAHNQGHDGATRIQHAAVELQIDQGIGAVMLNEQKNRDGQATQGE